MINGYNVEFDTKTTPSGDDGALPVDIKKCLQEDTMHLTILQIVLIGLWTGICWTGMLLGTYTFRSLILATGVGLILGDVQTGLAIGAL